MIQQNCTSTLKTTKHDVSRVSVDVCYTHYDHEGQRQHTWLTKKKCQKIAALLQRGVSKERILEDIRSENSHYNKGTISRAFILLDKKILYSNIMNSFGSDVHSAMLMTKRVLEAWWKSGLIAKITLYYFASFKVNLPQTVWNWKMVTS